MHPIVVSWAPLWTQKDGLSLCIYNWVRLRMLSVFVEKIPRNHFLLNTVHIAFTHEFQIHSPLLFSLSHHNMLKDACFQCTQYATLRRHLLLQRLPAFVCFCSVNVLSNCCRRPPTKTSRLQLKPGLFWYSPIQKCTKWFQMAVHGLKFWQILAKLQCASFLVRKIPEERKTC